MLDPNKFYRMNVLTGVVNGITEYSEYWECFDSCGPGWTPISGHRVNHDDGSLYHVIKDTEVTE